MTWVPLMSARPSFGWSSVGFSPARSRARFASSLSPSQNASPSPTSASRHVCEGREISARAHRALLRNDGMNAGVEHGDERVESHRVDPRVAGREGVDAQEEDGAHDVLGEGLAHPRRVAPDQVELELLEVAPRDDDVAKVAEARVDAVDDALALEDVLDDVP